MIITNDEKQFIEEEICKVLNKIFNKCGCKIINLSCGDINIKCESGSLAELSFNTIGNVVENGHVGVIWESRNLMTGEKIYREL